MTRQNCNWLLLGWAELALQCLLLLLQCRASNLHDIATIPASGGQMRFLYDVWSLAGQCRRRHSSRMANKGGVTRLSEAAVADGQCKMDMIMIWLWCDCSMIWKKIIYKYIYIYMNMTWMYIIYNISSAVKFSLFFLAWGSCEVLCPSPTGPQIPLQSSPSQSSRSAGRYRPSDAARCNPG